MTKSEYPTLEQMKERFYRWVHKEIPPSFIPFAKKTTVLTEGKQLIEQKWSEPNFRSIEVVLNREGELSVIGQKPFKIQVQIALEVVRETIAYEIDKDNDWIELFDASVKKGELRQFMSKIEDKHPELYEEKILPLISSPIIAPLFGMQCDTFECDPGMLYYE
jgi:hypothetical protein